jgi:predicted DNA-binding protein
MFPQGILSMLRSGFKMVKETSIRVTMETKQRLFELKCAWRLKSFDATIQKLIAKRKRDVENNE